MQGKLQNKMYFDGSVSKLSSPQIFSYVTTEGRNLLVHG